MVNTADIPHYFGVDPALQIGTITYKDYDDVTADVVTVTLDVASIGDRVWFDANKDGTVTKAEFDAALGRSIEAIYKASTVKN